MRSQMNDWQTDSLLDADLGDGTESLRHPQVVQAWTQARQAARVLSVLFVVVAVVSLVVAGFILFDSYHLSWESVLLTLLWLLLMTAWTGVAWQLWRFAQAVPHDNQLSVDAQSLGIRSLRGAFGYVTLFISILVVAFLLTILYAI